MCRQVSQGGLKKSKYFESFANLRIKGRKSSEKNQLDVMNKCPKTCCLWYARAEQLVIECSVVAMSLVHLLQIPEGSLPILFWKKLR